MLPADPANPDCACRHRPNHAGPFADNLSTPLGQSGNGSIASNTTSRTQIQWSLQASAHFPHSLIQDPRGFLLPRFVNVGRHLMAVTVAMRPTSKNLQGS